MERESREERERENLMKRSEKRYLKKNKTQSYNSSVYLHIAKM